MYEGTNYPNVNTRKLRLTMMKLNLGCGTQTPQGWINVDYALGAKLAKLPLFSSINRKLGFFNINWDKEIFLHDLTTKFPWKDGQADYIYSSHTLEHLTREEGLFFLKECHRILREGGVIRIVVPDLRVIVENYLNGTIRAVHFLEELRVLYGGQHSRFKRRLSPFIQFPHKCMYDSETLLAVMCEIGFKCEKKKAFSSRIKDINRVELESRTQNAVIVEGEKP